MSRTVIRVHLRGGPILEDMGVKGKMKATAVAEDETVADVLSTMRKLVVKGMSEDIVDKLAKEISDYKLALETAGELRVLGEDERPCSLIPKDNPNSVNFIFISPRVLAPPEHSRSMGNVAKEKEKKGKRERQSQNISFLRSGSGVKEIREKDKEKDKESDPSPAPADDLIQKDIHFISLPQPTSIEIKAASLDKLLEFLTHESFTDPRFRDTFLLTYRSFSTGSELLGKLIDRFRAKDLENEKVKISRRIRTLSVLKAWIEDHYRDFEQDAQLTEDFLSFVNGEMGDLMSTSASQLAKIFEKQKEAAARDREEKEASLREQKEKEEGEGGAGGGQVSLENWLRIDTHVLAEHMTLLESQYYCAITPKECIASSKGKKDQAGNISAMIAQFNRVSSWVVTQLCTTIYLEERVKKLEKLISLCEELFQMQNFNGTMEVLSGLNNSAVRRMKATWEGLSKETETKFQSIETTMSHEHSYKTYRGLLHNLNPPCVPYLGMYLTDMVFIEEGNKDKIDGVLINFQKRTKLGEVITEVKQYQIDYRRQIYGQKKNVADFLLTLPSLPDNDCYLYSVKVEPKDLNYEKVIEKGIQEEESLVRKLRGLKISCRQLERRLAELRGEQLPPELTDANVGDDGINSSLSLSSSIAASASQSREVTPTHDLSSSSSDAFFPVNQLSSSSPPPQRPPRSPSCVHPRSPIPIPVNSTGTSTPDLDIASNDVTLSKEMGASRHPVLHRNHSSIDPVRLSEGAHSLSGSLPIEEEHTEKFQGRDRSGSVSRKLRKLEKKEEKREEKREEKKERELKGKKKALRSSDKRKSALGVIWTPPMWGGSQSTKTSDL